MTDKIMIDGVDVLECPSFSNWHVIMTSSGTVVKEIENCCTPRQKSCKEINCIFKKQYKQLARKTEECEKTKNCLQELQTAYSKLFQRYENKGWSKEYDELKSQLQAEQQKVKELKNRLKVLDDEDITVEITEEEFARYNKYKQALEEIEGIMTQCLDDIYFRPIAEEILQKCEVLDE